MLSSPKRVRFRGLPIGKSEANTLWREKTSFASNASGDPGGQPKDPRLVARRVGLKDKTLAGSASRPRTTRLAPSGPRPNALPLHDVRYRKDGNPKGAEPSNAAPEPENAAALSRLASQSGNEIDQNLIGKDRIDRAAAPNARPPQKTGDFRLLKVWWSQTGSNRRPHACKARALPTELWPRQRTEDRSQTTDKATFRRLSSVLRRPIMVGLGGLEPPTSRLSSARSNQLSYKPESEDRGQTTESRYPFSVVCRLSSDVR